MSSTPQSGILSEVPKTARYLSFELTPGTSSDAVESYLGAIVIDDDVVIGIGSSLVAYCGGLIPGLRAAPALTGPGVASPSTPAALWVWLKDSDAGALVHRTRALQEKLDPAFQLSEVIDAFFYNTGRDLTGYIDGTENPSAGDAPRIALVAGAGPGLDGSSFVAVQRWDHDLDAFFDMSQLERDHTIGRQLSDNEEIDDAPNSAHVKRTAQEDFKPEAYVVRRSMPWSDPEGEGLVFVAFASSFDPFEALLGRMLGLEDGTVDALFRFTQPTTGAYFWCPPVDGDHLDLSALE